MGAHRVVEGDGLQDVHELALVFVDALHLDVEHGGRIDPDPHPRGNQVGKLVLVVPLDGGKALAEARIGGEAPGLRKPLRIVEHRLADALVQKGGKLRVGAQQPAPRRDAVGLVVDAARVERVEIAEYALLHQRGVECGHAVDRVRARIGELAHAHAPPIVLVDERDGGKEFGRAVRPLLRIGDEARVDLVDDLHVARQHVLEQVDGPAFQRLRQQRVVGVADRAPGDVPGLVPVEAVVVDENAHELRHGDGRVRVVELDRHLLCQRMHLAILLHVAADDVLQRGGGEEILLPEPKLLPGGGRVGGIEHAGDDLRLVALGKGCRVVAAVEGIEADRVHGACRPQPQRIDPLAAPADDRRVTGGGHQLFCWFPLPLLAVAGLDAQDHLAAEADLIGRLTPPEFPGVAVLEPVFRQFHLPAVLDLLAEQAVVIADAVAVGGYAEARHALHEAGGQAPQPAIAQRRIRLEGGNKVDVDIEVLQCLGEGPVEFEVVQRVAQQPADQELEREVIDALGLGLVGGPG